MTKTWQDLIEELKLFWQYPVCTEKEFFQQNKAKNNYLGFPWATVLDKNIDLNWINKTIKSHIDRDVKYYTCCQHISFRELKDLFQDLNVNALFTTHKCTKENRLGNISLLPCPLYAVNLEDKNRNLEFSEKEFISIDRDLLFSFMGAIQGNYLSNIRNRIFKLEQKHDIYIENTGDWHFNELVYTHLQNYNETVNESTQHKDQTKKYNKVLLRSRYSLCPSGSGPNSIRFWESLGVGAIPVLLSDHLELPHNDMWESSILRIKESELEKVPSILRSIKKEEEDSRRKQCLKIYEFYRNNYTNAKEIL